MSLYVKLETCPCGRCVTSWSRGSCYWTRAQSLALVKYTADAPPPADYDEIQAIGALWKHRADDNDGYSVEDEHEWYRQAYGRNATAAELVTWGRAPVDYRLVPLDHLVDTMFSGDSRERAARRAGEAFQAITGYDWRAIVANGRVLANARLETFRSERTERDQVTAPGSP